jgi:Fe-S oxidoreductase
MLNLALWGVRAHQFLSFSRLFGGKIEPGANVFFPGCTMIGHSPELTIAVFEYLRGIYPGIAFSENCCAKPAMALSGGASGKYHRVLVHRLKGARRVIVCCPNCASALKKLLDAKMVLSVWQVLEANMPELSEIALPPLVLHDPCPTRSDPAVQSAVRSVLKRADISFAEYPKDVTGPGTICCGKVNMTMALNPQKGRAMLSRALSREPAHSVLTYCFSCVDSFKSVGRESVHALECLFPTKGSKNLRSKRGSAARVWFNRLRMRRVLRGAAKNKQASGEKRF